MLTLMTTVHTRWWMTEMVMMEWNPPSGVLPLNLCNHRPAPGHGWVAAQVSQSSLCRFSALSRVFIFNAVCILRASCGILKRACHCRFLQPNPIQNAKASTPTAKLAFIAE